MKNFKSFFQKKEHFFGLDIGSSASKYVELDVTGVRPRVTHCGLKAFPSEVFASYTIQQAEKAANAIIDLLENFNSEEKKVVMSVPGPSIFTKRIKIPKVPLSELNSTIQLEAGNFIPFNINDVHLDYHIFGETGKNQLDILVVAVKNEVLESYLDTATLAGLNVGIADVDFFALQNVFEINYPGLIDKNIALVNIGARYSSVNICKGGESLFTGDIAIGGKMFTEALVQAFNLPFADAEAMKLTGEKMDDASKEIINATVEEAVDELNRQLSFFWNTTGLDESIDGIFLSGGGSLVHGLSANLQEKTGIECIHLNPFHAIDNAIGDTIENPEQYAVAVGLSMRKFGDKILPVIG